MTPPIRAGSPDEVERCIALWTRVIAARDGDVGSAAVEARARAASERPVVRFAVAGSAPDGFALTVVRSPGVAELSRLCVDPSVSSRGLGSALVADATECARRAGCVRIELDVRETNARATALYARWGFTPSSDPWRYDDGDRMVTWTLDLPAGAGG